MELTPAQAQALHNELLVQENTLQIEAAAVDLAMEAASMYRDIVAAPGWGDASEYLAQAGAGLWILASITPVGWVGISATAVGFYLASDGVIGAAAYLSESLSRTAPEIFGTANSNTGTNFSDTKKQLGLSLRDSDSRAADMLRDDLIERMIERLADAKHAPPGPVLSLPGRDDVKDLIENLERKKDELQRERDRLLRELYKPATPKIEPRAAGTKSDDRKPRPQSPAKPSDNKPGAKGDGPGLGSDSTDGTKAQLP